MPRKYVNLDDQTAIFFERQLVYVKQQTYDIIYPEMKARMLIPVDTTAGPGAEFIKYEQFDQVGIAQFVSNYAKDFPRASIKGKEFLQKVRSLGDSYSYTVQEIRNAQMAGLPLNARLALAAKRGIFLKENRTAFLGDTEYGFLGLLNHPNIGHVTLPTDGTGTVSDFLKKTPEQVLRDLNLGVTSIINTTKGVESPNTILLSPSYWGFLSTLKIPYSDYTVLEFFLKNSPSCKNAEMVPELESAGVGSIPRIIWYDRNPMKLQLAIPQDFEQFPPQEVNLEFQIPCHSRFGGVLFYYPLSAAYTDDGKAVL